MKHGPAQAVLAVLEFAEFVVQNGGNERSRRPAAAKRLDRFAKKDMDCLDLLLRFEDALALGGPGRWNSSLGAWINSLEFLK